MAYKKIKKIQKTASLISNNLIVEKRFEEIITILQGKSELSTRDRYIYGYALLQKQEYTESLLTLWPMTKHGNTLLREDCIKIGGHVFRDRQALSFCQMSGDALHKLLLAAQNLVPENPVVDDLEQRLLESLWEKGDYEKLESVLKISNNKYTGILVENLSKLDFYQPGKKLNANITGLISHVLTGGACLIARNPEYHKDFRDCIQALANELKLLFSQVKNKINQTVSWDKDLFANFVDYEASVIIQVLALFIKNPADSLDIIPTPSYLVHYDSNTRGIGEKFFACLLKEDEGFVDLYDPDSVHAVILALGARNSTELASIIKLVHKKTLHPYLRLALMLRAESIKPASLQGLVTQNEFTNLREDSTGLLQQVVTQTVKSIMQNQMQIAQTVQFCQLIFDFFPVLKIPALQDYFAREMLQTAHLRVEKLAGLAIEPLEEITNWQQFAELKQQISLLRQRKEQCMAFVLSVDTEKKAKKCISNIKNEADLRAHLCLIVDSLFLINILESADLVYQIELLVTNKKINKIIAIKQYVNTYSGYFSENSIKQLIKQELPALAAALQLPIVSLPSLDLEPEPANAPTSSILTEEDPFKILGIALTDSKTAIMQKMMLLMQKSPEKMASYRQAQNAVFQPKQRFLHQYFRLLATEPRLSERENTPPAIKTPFQAIPLRQEFL